MRILYLHQYFNTPAMSGGTRSYEMARRLADAGHEVHMITTARSGRVAERRDWYVTDEDGISVHWLPVAYSNEMGFTRRLGAFFRFAAAAAWKAGSIGGDVVFATSTPLTIALPGVLASKVLRVPMVFEVRDLWPEVPTAVGALTNPITIAAARWLERFAYRNASHIVALSPGMKEGVVRTGIASGRVSVIPNSSDLELFRVDAGMGEAVRAAHPWLGDRPLVVYIGTFGLINGVEYLAHLAAAVGAVDPEIRFVAIGSGREESKVRETAAERGVLGRSFFMLDRIPKAEVPGWLAAADLATSLTIDREETWANSANKFFDALAAGTPVAINYGGWQAELLRETGAGLVLPPGEPDRAGQAVSGFVRDRARLDASGQAAARLARERFDRDALADRLRRVLEAAGRGGSV